MTLTRRNFAGLALSLSGVALLAGCGSGGGDSMATTRKRVQTIDRALGSRGQFDPMLMLAGANGGAMADSLGGFMGNNGLPAVGFGGKNYSRAKSAPTRDIVPGFYYDGYLKLWAQKSTKDTDTSSETRYDFFIDEGKTQPAGFVSSLQPRYYYPPVPALQERGADDVSGIPPFYWNPTFPQISKTEYRFTAGTLAGSNGISESRMDADYSFTSRYENNYADGWKDRGNNRSDSGSSNWFARIETPEGKFAESAGTFTGAIGGSRMSSSDGYSADYQFTSGGSGRGTISGPDPGLPVTSSWDASGNVVVKYADGTTETFSRNGNPMPDDPGFGGERPIPVEGDGGIGNAKGV